MNAINALNKAISVEGIISFQKPHNRSCYSSVLRVKIIGRIELFIEKSGSCSNSFLSFTS